MHVTATIFTTTTMASSRGLFLKRVISQMFLYNIITFLLFILFLTRPCLASPCPGEPISEDNISPWNIDISRNGPLPRGNGTPLIGKNIYLEKCAACHGASGDGFMDIYPALRGGIGSLATKTPLRTVGSFWPSPESVLDYVRRAMPLNAPQSLNADDLYSVVSYLLYINNIIPQDFPLNEKTISSVKMPNRNGFIDTGEENGKITFPYKEVQDRLGNCFRKK